MPKLNNSEIVDQIKKLPYDAVKGYWEKLDTTAQNKTENILAYIQKSKRKDALSIWEKLTDDSKENSTIALAILNKLPC